jgi:hypothetical protein
MHRREGSRWFQLVATATVGKERIDVHGMIELFTPIGNLMEYCRADHRHNYLMQNEIISHTIALLCKLEKNS